VADEQFTLHRQVLRFYWRLPRLVRIWLVVVAVGALIELHTLLSGPSEEQRVRNAVAGAVRAATGPDPASSCSALSAAGLSQVVSDFGGGPAPATGLDQLAACERLVARLRAQALPQQLADFAGGGVRVVQFHADGSALVVYLAADRRLGAQLTLSQHGGRWLIDSVAGGPIAGAQ
jgi:hypothetical protein